ncbi:hypothetical protein ScFU97_10860 [Streptococcus canis]|nr:hypothetical protein JavanS89_0007 [Streptococcus satellite phage Javan89]GFG47747.1 hypothetical protein ScFU97_10860 [Streptococcus canis]VTR80910.1 phage protein [Streptococcus canis]
MVFIDKSLTPKQEKFMAAMVTSKTITEAAERAGIARVTAHKYLKDITFKRAFRRYRSELMQQTTALLQSASIEAVEVLREIALDKSISPYARQQSAQTILNAAYKAHELDDIVEMVEELEARFEVDQ